MSQTVYFNGAYLPKDELRLSPDDRGFIFADGVYEVVRSYAGALFALDEHLDRLARGLEAIQITGVDVPGLGAISAELLDKNGLSGSAAMVYIQVTRGAAPRAHAFPSPAVPPTVYVAATPLEPNADPARGVAAITVPDIRWARCDIKSIALLPNCLAHQQAHEAGAFEAVFVRDGVALEGTHTSLFGVFDGLVRTAPNSTYILPSITRGIVLDICSANGIPSEEAAILLEDLCRADELFLAGTTIEILPIVELDGAPVDTGRPGPVSRCMLELFHSRIG